MNTGDKGDNLVAVKDDVWKKPEMQQQSEEKEKESTQRIQ